MRPTRSRYFNPRSSASCCLRPSTSDWASERFWRTVRCGKSSKCWNTMPTRARSFGRFVFASLTLTPSTKMSPFCTGSRAFTVLMSVDLPDPDGPQTTITSPFSTLVVQSVSTWKLPYHLEIFLTSIIAMREVFPGLRSEEELARGRVAKVSAAAAASADDRDASLQPPDGPGDDDAD